MLFSHVLLKLAALSRMEVLAQWFLILLEVLNPASFIGALAKPFVIGKIKYDFF